MRGRKSKRRRSLSQPSEWTPQRKMVRLPNGRLIPAPTPARRRRTDPFKGQWGARVPGRTTERATDTPLPEHRRRDWIGGDQHAEWRRAPDGYDFTAGPGETGQQEGPDPIGDQDDNWDGGDGDE